MIMDLKKCPTTQPYDALHHLEEEEVKANEQKRLRVPER